MIDPGHRTASPSQLRCRQIEERDFNSVADLLTKGFAARSRRYWEHALTRLKSHPTPAGFPKFGYLLESNGCPVGAILLIFSGIPTSASAGTNVRCNISSWYVEPEFRLHGSLLVLHALRHKQVTYVNVSPAPHTRTTIEAQGFSRYCKGQLLAVPLLRRASESVRVQSIEKVLRPTTHALAAEYDLLTAHAALGCVCLWCTREDEAYPFIFLPRSIARGLPVLQLAYCRDWQDFVRFAGPIGRHLARRGRFLVLMDANGPVRGLPGKYFEGSGPKYFRGPAAPRLGDLAFTEGILFGA
jgi:hypothetical protein